MKDRTTQQLLEMTRNTYDSAAEEFSSSRAKFWEELEYLLAYAKPNMRVLDIGSGNGRLYPLLCERVAQYTGIDNSRGLLEKARTLYPTATFIEGDATALPFPDRSFDLAYTFATLHHMPGKAARTQFLREAERTLKEGGVLVVTVWDLWTPKYFLPLLFSFITSPFSGLDAKDLLLPLGKDKRKRYLHAFTTRELARLLETNGFLVENIRVIARKSGARNIVAVARLRPRFGEGTKKKT